MKWKDLPRGSFTQIDWSKPGATTGFDPYLVWAESDQFASFGKNPPAWLSLAIELTADTTVAAFVAAGSPRWLSVPAVYTSDAAPSGLRFCTARVRPEFFQQIRPGGALHKLIERFELGMPLGADAADPGACERSANSGQKPLSGKVLAIIDGGLAFANANFLHEGKARTRYLWRQDDRGVGTTPESMGYGHELTAQDIDQALQRYTFDGLVDEGCVYRHFCMGMEYDKLVNHGTHVMDLAGGPRLLQAQVASPERPPSWALANDDASRAPLIAVLLDWDTVRDTSGGSMNVNILDGLLYILSRCTNDAKVAVNLSWGTLAGPHDGTSLLEAAMDQLIELKKGLLSVVVPAGNSYQSRTHANVTLTPSEEVTLHWRVPPDDATPSFLELWFEEGHKDVEVEISPPGCPALPAVQCGESKMGVNEKGSPSCFLIYPTAVATGERGTSALLALAPTFSFDRETTVALSGPWRVTLKNCGRGSVTIDAYVERDDEIIGVRTGARQSHFEDPWYDTSGDPKSFVDHADNPSPIRRSGNFNSISTGNKTLTVGGVRLCDGSWALYSPRRPDPDPSRRQRPGVILVPETEAASDETPASVGVGAAGTRSSSYVRLVGTSDAAPQVARKVFNAM